MRGEHVRLRILYIARAFPPTLGGMETFAWRLSEGMRAHADVTMLVNRAGKKALPLFLPYAFLRGASFARAGRIDAVHLADALLAPLGSALKKVTGLPVTASVCGLDVTYPNSFYQALVPRRLAQLDMTMPISTATEAEVHARAGGNTPTRVVPLGMNALPGPDPASLAELRARARLHGGELVLLTVGRLIKRKGVAWFVTNVLPELTDETVYVVAGAGPEAQAIENAALLANVAGRVRLLGRVPSELLAAAYQTADVFVMPNIPVAGDIEGFGLVALEAAGSGLPVVASRLEGITEAIQDGHNGFLVAPRSTSEYVGVLKRLLEMPGPERRALGAEFARYTNETYSWDRVARRYVETISELAA